MNWSVVLLILSYLVGRSAPVSAPMTDSPVRVCFLPFGDPSISGAPGVVGLDITAASLQSILPELERLSVDVIVFDVNASWGYWSEAIEIQDLIQFKLKPRFRTVAWIRKGTGDGAKAVYPIEEMYVRSDAVFGACTCNIGNSFNPYGGTCGSLEECLDRMQTVSDWGGRDRLIMRSMQIMEPLAAASTASGVHWSTPRPGAILINPPLRILTLDAGMALRVSFARAIAHTRLELITAVLGPDRRFEIVGDHLAMCLDHDRRERRVRAESLVNRLRNYRSLMGSLESMDPFQLKTEDINAAISDIRFLQQGLREDDVIARHVLNTGGSIYLLEEEQRIRTLRDCAWKGGLCGQ
jgi:hypothetical protein